MNSFNLNEEESFYLPLMIQEREGTISSTDAKKLLEWRQSNPSNDSLYLDMIKLEDELSLLKIYLELNPQTSLENLHQKLNGDNKPEETKQITLKLKKWIGIAAAFLLILSGVFYFLKPWDTVTLKTSDLSKHFILPDGSKLTLNNNSIISYSKDDFNKERKLKLVTGECFLDIVHNPAKPFSIHYKNLEVTDIGTSFNFRVMEGQIKVMVNSGKVALKVKTGAEITYLAAGETASYNLESQKTVKSKIRDDNYKAYVDHHLYFNDTPLTEVFATLEAVYHQKIIIVDPEIKSRRFTAEFKDQNLKNILLVISRTLNLKVTSKNKVIYIESKF